MSSIDVYTYLEILLFFKNSRTSGQRGNVSSLLTPGPFRVLNEFQYSFQTTKTWDLIREEW